ncbi:FHA domain-containing protein [Seongchinamella unica]|uniref:FHA domain-containing protein n=1 Tax=Seongchinamella unica TaxID=2547392 RepID=A0A4R5LNB7_9GAMM|nr:FHA domain-containing protein [Seongchinamella unica]TDG11837.1 FHA domain-containing protein [Seongchinamella unica]
MAEHFLLRNMSTNENIPLVATSIILGRRKDCEIVVDSSEASREHARIRAEDGRLTLEDLGSTNGTMLNRRRLRQQEPLSGGDIISIGQVHFMVVAPGSDSHMTVLGGRLARADDNYVLDQADPNATGLRMPFPLPPGWTTTDGVFDNGPAKRNPQDIVSEQMASQSIGQEGADGVLMIVSDRGRNTLFPLRAGKAAWVIGRADDCDIAISDATISCVHALITRDAGRWSIEDKNSTNGTRLNGRRVDKAALDDGDKLNLGKVDLLFKSIECASTPG